MAKGKGLSAPWPALFALRREALDGRVFVNSRGVLDLKSPDGKGLYEELPPQLFFQDWVVDPAVAAQSAAVLVGVGIGYGLNHLLTSTPDSYRVLVVEPDPEVLFACLGQSDYTPFIKAGKLLFCPPDEEALTRCVRGLDTAFLFGTIHLRQDLACRALGPDYARWGGKAQAALENFSVELATLRKRQDLMVSNELRNWRRAMNDGSLTPLKGRGKGLTAVGLCAGPSLELWAPMLAQNRDSLLLTAAVQTLPALKRLHLKPHFCVGIDYSDGMMALYNRLDLDWAKDVTFIYSTKMKPELIERWPGPTVPLWTLGGLASFVLSNEELVLDAGGNVANAMHRLFQWLGVDRVVLAGQDFAWKGAHSHLEGHHAHAKNWNGADLIRLKDASDEDIVTTLSLLTALRDMERDALRLGVPTIHLYGGGAVIAGVERIDSERRGDYAPPPSEPGALESFLRDLAMVRRPRQAPRFEPRAHTWEASIRRVLKHFEKLFKKPSRNHAEIQRTLVNVKRFLEGDPLYYPYLYNEASDVTGMAAINRGKTPDSSDFLKIKALLGRVRTKVREMDAVLAA